MMNTRYRALLGALAALAAVWLLAWGGLRLAGASKMTAEKFAAFAGQLDLSRLQGEQRARALRELADKLNRLPLEERRQVRLGRGRPDRLFQQMTEQEQSDFIEATMPTGFKQMLTSFEQLPEDKRKAAIDRAMRRLRAQRSEDPSAQEEARRPPEVSEEVRRRIVAVGLRTFYKESSAQTRAEMAPLLEEIQRAMESGHLFHP
jgi:hypothetical protein